MSGFSPNVLETLGTGSRFLALFNRAGCGLVGCSFETRLQALLILCPQAVRYQTPISMSLHFECGAWNLRSGFAVYSLYFEPAMVNAGGNMRILQSLVREG